MKCEEFLRLINDYVDGEVDPSICDEFEEHLKWCNPCEVVVDNIRNTITLCKNGATVELPIRFRKRLHGKLRERWDELHAD